MTFYRWSEDLSVGNHHIDGQHQKLIDIINRYHDALERKAPRAELMRIFQEVADYAIYHFRDEEGLMERQGFPGLAKHRIIHQQLIARVEELQQQLAKGDAGIESQIKYFLKTWLTAHIKGIDHQYMPYLADRPARTA